MASINNCTYSGNLGGDVEVTHVSEKNTKYAFSLAVSRSFVEKGERKNETMWFNVVAWNGAASGIAQYLTKGREVGVQGETIIRKYPKKDGTTGVAVEINALKINLIGRVSNNNNSASFSSDEENFDDDDEETPPWAGR